MTHSDNRGNAASKVRAITEELGLLFDRVAEDYDRVRRGYPAVLIDAACAIGSLSPGSPVVEVGAGLAS